MPKPLPVIEPLEKLGGKSELAVKAQDSERIAVKISLVSDAAVRRMDGQVMCIICASYVHHAQQPPPNTHTHDKVMCGILDVVKPEHMLQATPVSFSVQPVPDSLQQQGSFKHFHERGTLKNLISIQPADAIEITASGLELHFPVPDGMYGCKSCGFFVAVAGSRRLLSPGSTHYFPQCQLHYTGMPFKGAWL